MNKKAQLKRYLLKLFQKVKLTETPKKAYSKMWTTRKDLGRTLPHLQTLMPRQVQNNKAKPALQCHESCQPVHHSSAKSGNPDLELLNSAFCK